MAHPTKSVTADAPPAGKPAASATAPVGGFVINLCASTTPMALIKPTAPELARFTFFVSRRREEGRERFRLHMGYFEAREEAESLLGAIRDLYPAAWVGEAPGKRLQPSAGAQPAPAPPLNPPDTGPIARAAQVAPAPARPTPPATTAPNTAATVQMPRPPAPPIRQPAAPPSNVREVLNSLDAPQRKSGNTQADARMSAAGRAATAPPKVTEPSPLSRIKQVGDGGDLSDSQVLRVLEQRRADTSERRPKPQSAQAAAVNQISMVGPEDTQTWKDIKAQLKRDAAVHFAVQLQWSVSPIDLGRLPGLAIFSAYTLYKIEGNRDGRKWYGLRLGFFSDAMAAKQVAFYVRSEFATVAVIPVSGKEREQAKAVGAIDLLPAPAQPLRAGLEPEDPITLLDDEPVADALPAQHAPASALPEPAAPEPTTVDAPRTPRPSRPRGPQRTLEETLEILGASQLSIDSGAGERLNLNVRSKRAQKSTSTFSKLLDRLSEKLRG